MSLQNIISKQSQDIQHLHWKPLPSLVFFPHILHRLPDFLRTAILTDGRRNPAEPRLRPADTLRSWLRADCRQPRHNNEPVTTFDSQRPTTGYNS